MAVQNLTYGGFDFSKIGQYWDAGAKDLEKTAIGKIVTSPVRIIEAATGSTTKALTSVGKVAEKAPAIAGTVPLLLIVLAGGIAAYLVFAGKKGVKLIP
jgi:hypothetical protein